MRILSLYCGAGGIDEGLKQAGLQTTLAIDSDPDCCNTMRANHPDVEVINSTVREAAASLGRYDMVVGGPPCQDFSRAKFNRTKDPTEIELFGDIIRNTKASHFLAENVPDARPAMKVLPGKIHLVDVADYGVPQNRTRAIATNLPLPVTTHAEFPTGTLSGLPPKKPWVSVRAALGLEGTLQDHKWGLTTKPRNRSTDRPARTVTSDAREWLVAKNHRRAGDWDQKRGLDRPSYTVLASPRLYLVTELKQKAWWTKHHPSDMYGPSRTVMCGRSHHSDDLIMDRTHAALLTPQALAVLQGFPPDYVFTGSNLRIRKRQIGNALPPPMTRAFVAPLELI